VVLGSDALDKLLAAGAATGPRVDLVRSGVSIAVRAGAPAPDVSTEEALKEAVLAAESIGYSTGPSGVALAKLFERWGVAAQLKDRFVQAPPGVPVGSLVERGDVALGFQQLSELIHQEGITIIGPMPDAVQITTIFSGAACAASTQPDAVRRLLQFLASPAASEAKRRQGTEPA
jgi:molybdate transport system substrate-binding protein